MSESLDLHVASPDEIVAAHQNVFDLWSKGRSMEKHVEFRLTSPSHSRATWIVGCVRQQVVTSLGCYPVLFKVDSETVRGSAIGSVYSSPEQRGKGYAAQLVDWADDYQRDCGTAISVLYSDIDPAYYGRRGYTICPSFEGWCDPQTVVPDDGDRPIELKEFDAGDSIEEMKLMYSEYHGRFSISVARDDAYWDSLLRRAPNDRYFWLQEPNGGRAGYARVQQQGSKCRITDYALANHDDALAVDFYTALLNACRTWDAKELGGWLPDSKPVRQVFPLKKRETEITMIKSLAPKIALTDDLIASSARFCEIDHV